MNELLSSNRNPHDISEKLNIPLSTARKMLAECPEDLSGWGPNSKQKNIVSRRHVSGEWPREHKERIEHFQKLHDQGRTSLCQGRDGSFFILYAMPHNGIVKRDSYFFVDRGY